MLCRRYGALPSQVLAEDSALLQMVNIINRAGGDPDGQ